MLNKYHVFNKIFYKNIKLKRMLLGTTWNFWGRIYVATFLKKEGEKKYDFINFLAYALFFILLFGMTPIFFKKYLKMIEIFDDFPMKHLPWGVRIIFFHMKRQKPTKWFCENTP